MPAIKKIGIITSGGDCGGLNAVIKGAAKKAHSLGIETVIIPNGYAGLYNLIDMDKLVTLTPERVGLIDATAAGSEAGNSRVKIRKIADDKKYERIKNGLKKFKIDGLIISGGDDTGSVVVDLLSQGIPCVHVPKTMDLDLQSYSVGGDSAINRIAAYVRDLKTTGLSHNRIMVIEVFGRYTGHTVFCGGAAAEADCILLPEIPVDFDVLYEDIKRRFFPRIEKSDTKRGIYTIVVAEGIKTASGELLYDEGAGVDAFGHKKLAGAAKYVKQQIEKRLKNDPEVEKLMTRAGMYVQGIYEIPEVREVVPGHLVRSGNSSAYDVNFGYKAGAGAVILLLEGKSGNTVVNVIADKIYYQQTAEVIKRREVDIKEAAFLEGLGICFGRKIEGFKYELAEIKGQIERRFS